MAKKEIERYYFEKFCKAYQLPDGEVKHGDKPDFIIHGNKKIGIEVTNAYIEDGKLPESEQNQVKGREEILSKAKREYLENNGKHIEISFSFSKDKPIRNKKDLIKRIVELAKRIDTFATGQIRRDIYQNIPELDFVYVNSALRSDLKWRPVQVYTIPILSAEKISEILSKKEVQATKYTQCDEYWLLIVVDFADFAQDQELPTDIAVLHSKIYKKIIVYKTVFNQVMEIWPHASMC